MSGDGRRRLRQCFPLFFSPFLSFPQTNLLIVLRVPGHGRDVRVVAEQLGDERARGGGAGRIVASAGSRRRRRRGRRTRVDSQRRARRGQHEAPARRGEGPIARDGASSHFDSIGREF